MIKNKPNVVGYSKTLKPKIKNGKVLDRLCFRVYVEKKVPESELLPEEIIPKTVILNEGEIIETDVVEIGKIRALVDKTGKFRPVELGVSIGNWNITAGSLGMLYKKDDKIYAGSNAHVLVDDPSKSPSMVTEKRILQPGPYHGGKKIENIVGYYAWHKRIVPIGANNCTLAKITVTVLNWISKILGRKTRFKIYSIEEKVNHIDFAVYYPTVEHVLKVADGSLTDEVFIGHLFAGSSRVGVICKAKYIVEEGYIPLVPWSEVQMGDIVKGCSFWCNYETEVIDESAVVNVSYGNFIARFDDVILVRNDGTIKGGWSGSGWRFIRGKYVGGN